MPAKQLKVSVYQDPGVAVTDSSRPRTSVTTRDRAQILKEDLKLGRGRNLRCSISMTNAQRWVVRAKLTELGIDYELVNVPASSKERRDLEKVAGTTAIPVLVDGRNVITDSDEALSYLEKKYGAKPDELELHHRELSPTVYGTLPFGIDEAIELLREALAEADIEVLQELDLSSALGRPGAYKVLIAADREFLRLAAEANPGAATLALLKIAVYEEDGASRVDAVEPEKGAGQIRSPQLNDRGLELRKRLIKTIKRLQRVDARV